MAQAVRGGEGLRSVARRFGTPVFIYDEEHIRQRLREVRTIFPGNSAYASKAFLCKKNCS